ncbi:MAG: hypothetical protein CM15mP53_08680 [Ectothiorhodospiraceae bacterium]|nr:MAG: hypothetical protein CM15mP53_08680 [Ectothiorhodospiraceae bacterium]
MIYKLRINLRKPTEPVVRDVKITQSMTVAELANQMALKAHGLNR